jgi:hypothetical protein
MGNALGVGGLVYWTCLEMNFIGYNEGTQLEETFMNVKELSIAGVANQHGGCRREVPTDKSHMGIRSLSVLRKQQANNFIGYNEGFGDWDSERMKLTELWDKLPTVAACHSPISPSVIGHPPEMLQKFWHNF